MNERILELADKAREIVSKELETYKAADMSRANNHWIERYNQTFAELIVRECINVIGESRESRQTAMYYRHRIAEHFGVE